MSATAIETIECPHCQREIGVDVLTPQFACTYCKGKIQIEAMPQPGPQTHFLNTDHIDIVGYGGQAGGGKSYAICLHPLKYIDNAAFRGIIFRRTRPQLRQHNGLWEESSNIYHSVGAEQNETHLEHRFPSGAKIKFGHMEHEKDRKNYDGSQYTFVGFDQAEHFTAEQVFYMLSRMRSISGIKPHMRLTFNPPDPNEPEVGFWLFDVFAPWVDEEFPNPARPGEVRYFIRPEDTIVWVEKGTPKAKSITFIPATVYDNKVLLSIDPGYIDNLEALPYEDRERLLHGSWKILSIGKMFKRAWFKVVEEAPRGMKMVRIWDNAASKGSGAFTVGLKMGLYDNIYYIVDVVREQYGTHDREDLQHSVAISDGYRIAIRQEQEPGSAGKDVIEHAIDDLFKGFDFKSLHPSGEGDKVTRAKPLAAAAEHDRVRLVKGEWNEAFLGEIVLFPHGKYKDQTDAAAWGVIELGGSYKPPDLEGAINKIISGERPHRDHLDMNVRTVARYKFGR